jgi:hypothetical protein
MLVGCPNEDAANTGTDTRVYVKNFYRTYGGLSGPADYELSPKGYCKPGHVGTYDGEFTMCRYIGVSNEHWCFTAGSFASSEEAAAYVINNYYNGSRDGDYWLFASWEYMASNPDLFWNNFGTSSVDYSGGCTMTEGGHFALGNGGSGKRNMSLAMPGAGSQVNIDNRTTVSVDGGASANADFGSTFFASTGCSSGSCEVAVAETALSVAGTIPTSQGTLHDVKFEQVGAFGFIVSRQTGAVVLSNGSAVFNLTASTEVDGDYYATSGGFTVDGATSSGTANLETGFVDIIISLKPVRADVFPSLTFHLVGDTPVRAPIADAGPDLVVECNPATKTGQVLLSAASSIAGTSPVSTYAWSTDNSYIGTSATVTSELTLGEHAIKLDVIDQSKRRNSDTMKATVVDTTAPSIQLSSASQRIDACSTSPLAIPTPTATDCTATTVTGVIVQRDGVTVSEPFSGKLPAYPGKTVIRWSAVDAGGHSSSVDQTVEISPSLIGKTHIGLRDRVIIQNHGTTFGPMLGGIIDVGNGVQTGNIYSPGKITLGDRDVVNGSTFSPVPVGLGNDVTITNGMVVSAQTVPTLPSVSVTPGTMDIDVSPPVTVKNLLPGAYRAVSVKANTTLALSPGNYSFDSLTMETGSHVSVKIGATPILVKIKSNATVRGLTPTNFDPAALRFEYAGTPEMFIEPDFTGTVLAPSSKVTVGVGNGSQFTGSIRASDIELRPGVHFRCLAN